MLSLRNNCTMTLAGVATLGVLGVVACRASAVGDDPFARPVAAGVASAAPGPLEAFELTGISTLGGRTMVCLLDRGTQRTRWFTVGETEGGLAALEYDPARDAVRMEAGSSSRWIALRKAGIEALTLPHRDDGTIDWAHLRKSDKEKAREAEAMLTDILEVGQLARSGRLGAAP